MASAKNEYATLRVGDGSSMRAYVARPSTGGRHPGLMVFQEAFGVNAHIRDVAERFAQEGYVAFAPELFHRTAPGYEGDYKDFESALRHVQALTEEGMAADIRATFEALRADAGVTNGEIACVGFCLGGRVSFQANALLQIKAAISYYGGGIAPGPRGPGLLDQAGALHAPMLLFWGLEDKHIGVEQPRQVADALRAAGKPFVNVEFSDADHGFFCDARPSYNASAAAQSWAHSLQFLKIHCSG